MFIGNYIDQTKISTHTLLVNFRNPQDTVALLNKLYGYTMRSHSKIERSIEIITSDKLGTIQGGVPMCFSKASAKTYSQEEKNTVRANQGGTVKTAILDVVNTDGVLPSIEDL